MSEDDRLKAERLGDAHDHLCKALEKASVAELLWLLGVALDDRDAPELEKSAIRRALDSVEHDVVTGVAETVGPNWRGRRR